jgi:hypothetical protein
MSKDWREDEIGKLKRLRELGASVARASVALKRGKAAVKLKARELGIFSAPIHLETREAG